MAPRPAGLLPHCIDNEPRHVTLNHVCGNPKLSLGAAAFLCKGLLTLQRASCAECDGGDDGTRAAATRPRPRSVDVTRPNARLTGHGTRSPVHIERHTDAMCVSRAGPSPRTTCARRCRLASEAFVSSVVLQVGLTPDGRGAALYGVNASRNMVDVHTKSARHKVGLWQSPPQIAAALVYVGS